MKKNEKKKTDAAQGIMNALSSAYQRVPEFPYLDRATTLLLILCVLGFAAFTAYVFVTSPPVEIQARMLEGPLSKNSALMLKPGETYNYSVESPQGAQQVSYGIGLNAWCQGVVVSEQSLSGSQAICLQKNGMAMDGSGAASNENMGNGSMLLFSPWMLAASENFSWSVDTVYAAYGMEMNITTTFASKGKRPLAGREAYEIEVGDASGAAPARFFVDAQKRVLLYADLGNVTVKLTGAPFALDWNASAQN